MTNILDQISRQISDVSDTPSLDAQTLLVHITGKDPSYLLAHSEIDLTGRQVQKMEKSIARLKKGIPLPYILGHWEFFGHEFKVNKHVLIPRPETELLVEKALEWLLANPDKRKVIDVGTGSGCIAISLANRISDLDIMASDFSKKALNVAKYNARKMQVLDQIEFICCNLFPIRKSEIWTKFINQGRNHSTGADHIVANLPYIPTSTLKKLQVYGKEPEIALDGGQDGLDVIRRFMIMAPEYLNPGGRILLEIEASQGMSALSLAFDQFSEARIHLHKDLAGRDRILEINLQS